MAWHPESFTMDDLAEDVIALVVHLGYKSIDILGHSMGGMGLTMQACVF